MGRQLQYSSQKIVPPKKLLKPILELISAYPVCSDIAKEAGDFRLMPGENLSKKDKYSLVLQKT